MISTISEDEFIKKLKKASDKNFQFQNTENSLLSVAISNHFYKAIDILLAKKDINVNLKNRSGGSPLEEAIIQNLPNIVSKLIEKGADIEHVTGAGNTLIERLFLLSYKRNKEILTIFSNQKLSEKLKKEFLENIFKNRNKDKIFFDFLLNNIMEAKIKRSTI